MRTLVVLCALAGAASAQVDQIDPDTEAARRHFDKGRALYEQGRYDDALAEFEVARKLKPVPNLDFNIARTHERREAWGDAATAYERYLVARPDAPDAAEMRARIEVLRSRVAQPKPPRPSPSPGGARKGELVEAAKPAPSLPPHRRNRALRGAAIGVAIGAVVLAVVGAALISNVADQYDLLQARCSFRPCGSSDWAGLPEQANASYALFGLAGAAAAVDVALWVLESRQGRSTDRASLPSLQVRF